MALHCLDAISDPFADGDLHLMGCEHGGVLSAKALEQQVGYRGGEARHCLWRLWSMFGGQVMAIELSRCCLRQWSVCLRLSVLAVLGWIAVPYATDMGLLASLQ